MIFHSLKILLITLFILIPTSVFSFSDSLFSKSNENISYKIILIGDAGEPSKEFKEPVLQALISEASEIPESTLVIFLGDNVYSNGLPAEDDPERKEHERKINEQIDAVVEAGAEGIFIPGNHDWAQGNDDCWERIIRQAEYVNEKKIDAVRFEPVNGCPGPVVKDFGETIRIIILDSQWWFQDENLRPSPEDNLCEFCTENEIINSVESVINISENKFVVIASHHPLSTHGPHGGYFTWQDHIFPLTNINEYLWIPLPIIGSLYPLIRGSGVSRQDIAHEDYQNFKNKIEAVLLKYSRIIFASGHEHAIQILEGVNENLYVVSGAGVWGLVEKALGEGDDTIFAGKFEGFVTIDFLKDGGIYLNVIKVLNEKGDKEVVYSMRLEK